MIQHPLIFKFRRIFLPVVLLSLVVALVYSALNWMLVAKTGWLPLDEEVVDFWLPGALAWILVIVLLQPRLRFLKLKDTQGNLPILYHIAALAVVAVPVILAQKYIRSVTGDITHIENADLIASSPMSKYYVVESICMHMDPPASKGFFTRGRPNAPLSVNIYVMAPVCSTRGQSDHEKRVWIASHYHRVISNSASKAEINSSYGGFVRDSVSEFNALDPAQFRFLESIGRNSDRRRYEKTLEEAAYSVASPIILIPHSEPFERRSGERLVWAAGSFGVGALIWLVMVLIPTLDRHKIPREPKATGAVKARDGWRALFLPRRSNYGLPVLLAINIAVFVAMVLSGLGVVSFDSDDLLAWGASFRPAIHGLGVFRLISSQFVHGGLIHLVNNLYGLIFAGIFLRPLVNNGRLIACYLLCGLAGSIASVLMHPATISMGASGSIFGLFGILLTMDALGDARMVAARKFILLNAGLFVGLNLLIGATSSGIDNAAHVGGLVTGVALGLVLFLAHRARQSRVLGAAPEEAKP
ncbi:MAG TPA: rhomboid family intramembrane serine protease [Steroidobacteraceae bacterium]